MAFKRSERKRIVIDLQDSVYHSTHFKQRAIFTDLYHHQDENGVCSARIEGVLVAYSDYEGQYGEPLPMIPRRPFALLADNDTIVDVTGAILAIKPKPGPGKTAEQIELEFDALGHELGQQQDVYLQGDFFENLRRYQPLLIEDMCIQHIQQADQMGRFS